MNRDRLAAELFPDEWATWSARAGRRARKQRYRLRVRAQETVVLVPLREQGARCESCAHFRRVTRHGRGSCVMYDSSTVWAQNLCFQWKAKENA